MHPQRRTALVSVVAAILLIALKLGTGLATHSLGLISEAAHSGTDLIAALLTFFAVGVADRPADPGQDRKSTRLNSSHPSISYAVFCLKKKKTKQLIRRSTNS